MATTPQYDQLLADLAAGQLTELEQKVLDLLGANPDGLTRYELLEHIFGPGSRYVAEKRGLANSTDDRKIREAIESLRNNGVPVVSSSGKPGYRLDTSPEAVGAMIAEWQSRVENLQERIRKATQFYRISLPLNPAQSPRTIQGRLF
jgi:hypothetical protein